MKAIKSYGKTYNPWNYLLERGAVSLNVVNPTSQNSTDTTSSQTSTAGGTSTTSSGANGSVETMAVKSDGSSSDVWIKNFIRSENWKPKTVGFSIDGQSGYAEFCKVFVSGEVQALTGIIGGWYIGETLLSSELSGARIELDKGNNRVAIFDAVNSKVVMGYLNGLPKNSGIGNWGPGDYGFWVRSGDQLHIDGDGEYINGDWIVQNDAAYLINDGAGKTIVRLGTDTGEKGLFIYNTAGVKLAKYISDQIYIGTTGQSLKYDTVNGLVISGSITATTGSIGGWSISSDAIFFDGAADANSAGMATADFPFYAGKKYASRATAPFRVTPAGALYASSVDVSGKIVTGANSQIDAQYFIDSTITKTLTMGSALTTGTIKSYGWMDDESVTGYKIVGGASPSITLVNGTITGSLIRTAKTGRRIELQTIGTGQNTLEVYSDSGLELGMYDNVLASIMRSSQIEFVNEEDVTIRFPNPGASQVYVSFVKVDTTEATIYGYPDLTIDAYAKNHWLPWTNALDLGSAGDTWRDLHLSGDSYIGGVSTLEGGAYIGTTTDQVIFSYNSETELWLAGKTYIYFRINGSTAGRVSAAGITTEGYFYNKGANYMEFKDYRLTLTSNKTAIVPTSQGFNSLYCTESPEVWFMDFCEDKDNLDPLFLEVTNAPYHFIKCEGGEYQVWGKRREHEKYRFESKTEEEFIANERFLNMNKPSN